MKMSLYTSFFACVLFITGCANAGKDQKVESGELVYLDAKESTASKGGVIESYRWKQISGKNIELSSENEKKVSFEAPDLKRKKIFIFELTTVEIGGSVSPFETKDYVSIIVKPQNTTDIKFKTEKKLGKHLFFDKSLSKTGQTSCATCHNPKNAFVDNRFKDAGRDQSVFINGALSVGDDGFSLGGRNTPTIAYAQFLQKFDAKKVKGGQFHDGRAATLKDQAMGPPLDKAEMQMPDKKSVVDRIRENSDYVRAFKKLYGNDIFNDVNKSFESMAQAIAKFESTKQFAPFNSKYDRYKKCKNKGKNDEICLKQWNTMEKEGMKLFFSPTTNCIFCHTQEFKKEALENELFTNSEYRNIGVPKNQKALTARAALGLGDLNATDHGVYGAYPNDVNASFDGKVKVPTLRNVAVTDPYMTNGVFKNLRTVLEFYDHMGTGNRPINPETGKAWEAPNVESTVNRKPLGKTQILTDKDIYNLEAFLKTLTDKKYEHLLK